MKAIFLPMVTSPESMVLVFALRLYDNLYRATYAPRLNSEIEPGLAIAGITLVGISVGEILVTVSAGRSSAKLGAILAAATAIVRAARVKALKLNDFMVFISCV